MPVARIALPLEPLRQLREDERFRIGSNRKILQAAALHTPVKLVDLKVSQITLACWSRIFKSVLSIPRP